MGKSIDFTGIAMLVGLGYLVYKLESFRMPQAPAMPTIPRLPTGLFSFLGGLLSLIGAPSPALPPWIPPTRPIPIPEPLYVYRPTPTIINGAARGWKINGYVTPEPDELYGASRRGWLTAADITASERLAYEAQKAGVTDF